ncbi:MAG: type I-E CRISPR-associated protein Cas7/Cse4/CasC, partial [Endozoicomonadaceae bacterium]|nr:type I-E CRISPR-associated protein Cas7/Cse4/CasC [Endozoicomonadaceae bacterium]
MTNNALKNRRIEFHILQSFPVTCLNRNDVGSPKSAIVGGVKRARISSQCWKRQVRLALQDLGIKLGMRTKYIDRQVKDACLALGAEETAAIFFSKVITRLLAEDTLLFISEKEVKKFAEYAKGYSFDVREIIKPLISKANKKKFVEHIKKHSSDTNEIIKFILSDTEKEVFKENPEGYSLNESKIDSKEAKTKEVKKLTKFINGTIDVL